jgi:hypothetical protein
MGMIRINGAKLLYIAAIVAVCLAFAWKPIAIHIWRIDHPRKVRVSGLEIAIPFPWAISSTGTVAKLRSFSSLWPSVNDDDATAVMEATPVDQKQESDTQWFAIRTKRFADGGYNGIRSLYLHRNRTICVEAQKASTHAAYCRSISGINLIYSGGYNRLSSAEEILP